MAEYLIDGVTLTNIADSIRGKTSVTGAIKPSEMAMRISNIATEHYDLFWDIFQEEGMRTDYSHAFAGRGWLTDASGWPECNLRPKHFMKITNAERMFYASSAGGDLAYWATDISNGIDWSENASLYEAFMNNTMVYRIGEVGAFHTMANAFNGCTNLTVIERLTLPRTVSLYSCMGAFSGCVSLELLTLDGKIRHNNFDVSDCTLLTLESLVGILDALEDKTGDNSLEWKVTLGDSNLAKLTDEQKAAATQKGWVLA